MKGMKIQNINTVGFVHNLQVKFLQPGGIYYGHTAAVIEGQCEQSHPASFMIPFIVIHPAVDASRGHIH
jgi:hypothetical protein